MKNPKELRIVEFKENSIIVMNAFNAPHAIARHEDEGGVYFYDENNQKKYVKDATTLNRYTFKTELYCERKGTKFMEDTRTFLAANRDEALEVQAEYYSTPMNRELVSVKQFGN